MNEKKVKEMIINECEEIKKLLIEKNSQYGNAAFESKNIFSKVSNIEKLKIRIDDKLSRIDNMAFLLEKDGSDTVKDLIGYLILLRIAQKEENIKEQNVKEENEIKSIFEFDMPEIEEGCCGGSCHSKDMPASADIAEFQKLIKDAESIKINRSCCK